MSLSDMLGKFFAGLLRDLLEKLSGEDGDEWMTALAKFLRKENPWPVKEWAVWKTVTVGTQPSVEALRTALKAVGHKIGDWANDILSKITVATEPTAIELVMVTVAELGFPDGATVAQIFERAVSLGLELLPAEVGPQLRLQYVDQSLDEWILIGMEPIADSYGGLEVFYVGRYDDGLWLFSSCADPGSKYDGDCRWAFGRKHQS